MATCHNLLLEYVDFKVFFPHNVEIMDHFFRKKILCTSHKVENWTQKNSMLMNTKLTDFAIQFFLVYQSIYERKVVCLWHWDLPIHNTSCHVLGTIGKSSTSRDAPSWFHNVSTYGGKMIDYWKKNLWKFI